MKKGIRRSTIMKMKIYFFLCKEEKNEEKEEAVTESAQEHIEERG